MVALNQAVPAAIAKDPDVDVTVAAPSFHYGDLRLAAAIVRALGDSSAHAKLRLGAWKQAQKHHMRTHVDRLMAIFRSLTESGNPSS